MRGGHLGIKRTCALRKVGVTLLAIHFSWASVATPCALAESDPSDEQSIVILGEKPIDGQGPAIIEGMLEPITENSVIKPDLAEPIEVAQVPTLANPLRTALATMKVSSPPPCRTLCHRPQQTVSCEEGYRSALLTLGKIEVASFMALRLVFPTASVCCVLGAIPAVTIRKRPSSPIVSTISRQSMFISMAIKSTRLWWNSASQ